MNPENSEDLIRLLENRLPFSVCARGKNIFEYQPEDIELVLRDSFRLITHVRGSGKNPYKVKIERKEGRKHQQFELSCNCPFFKSYQNFKGCKHLYASALFLGALPDRHKINSEDAWKDPFQYLLRVADTIEEDRISTPKKTRSSKLVFKLKPHVSNEHEISFKMAELIESDPPKLKVFSPSKLSEKSWSPEDQLWVDRLVSYYAQSVIEYYGSFQWNDFQLPFEWINHHLPQLIKEKRLWRNHSFTGRNQLEPIIDHLSPPCSVVLKGKVQEDELQFDLEIWQGLEHIPKTAEATIFADGLLLISEKLFKVEPEETLNWFIIQEDLENIRIPKKEAAFAIQELYKKPAFPRLELPTELSYQLQVYPLQPELKIHTDDNTSSNLSVEVFWRYGETLIPESHHQNPFPISTSKRLIERDIEAEQKALTGLEDYMKVVPTISSSYKYQPSLARRIPQKNLYQVLPELIAQGWAVFIEKRKVSSSNDFDFEIKSSSIDWFDVHATISFGDQTAELPQLLSALRQGKSYIKLANGEIGFLPPSLTKQLELLQKFGTSDEEGKVLRFKGANTLLLNLMMEELPDLSWDEEGSKLRDRLEKIQQPQALKAPRGFIGTLRPYQEEGLGWLSYLQEIGIQGCLADDMGLGKTIQVLALLEKRRHDKAGPSIVVMPKSLVHNWLHEAAKFTPKLSMCELTGSDRPKSVKDLPKAQVYLTTYSLLQRDIHWLKEKEFDYAILDESQAIKNAKTKSAKSCRLLKANHRLTMTGTPVENRLGDLFSQLDFLNPGLLNGVVKNNKVDEEYMDIVGKAIRPFLLRRTKEEVVKDLPKKYEETLFCEMTTQQSKKYNELKKYYQLNLNKTVEDKGLNRSKIMVLEAMLRLRQAACHPGLLDAKLAGQSCGKLDILKDMLSEIIPTGHKALIFSQFTSFLALTRDMLDKEGYTYAYLDGKSTDRPEQIERFQTSEDCNLFLISLKAGGVGLNLTAADYVFLLDPWWNPAIEAQAIDRAHRIGQKRKVFAYRIVAENTIEDKILQLQAKKKELADAILKEENSLLSGLTMEDLNFLLG